MTIEDLGTPNCEKCLTTLELAGTDERPYWFCPSCKVAHLT